jgi:glycosyltransferase involved in cell wall biosynthesis
MRNLTEQFKVTIVVPIYNGAEHILDTINALLRQTYTNILIMCIDDGSKDNTLELLRKIDDRRLVLISQENIGLCETMNRAIRECKTTYIARNDQDDISDTSRIEKQIRYLEENPEVSCVFSHYEKVGKAKTWSNSDKQLHKLNFGSVYNNATEGCLLQSTMCCRLDALQSIGGYRKDFYPSDDYDLVLRLSERYLVHVLREPLVKYRFHGNANTYKYFKLMLDKSRWTEDCKKRREKGESELTFENFLHNYSTGFWSTLHGKRLDYARMKLRIAGQRYLDGELFKAGYHFLLSCLFNPTEIKNRIYRKLGK